MHSHMYFYAESARPDWGSEHPDTPESRERERTIADALIAAVPALREMTINGCDGPGIALHLSPLDWIVVYSNYVHWDIKYRCDGELAHYGTMPILRTVEATLLRVAGFDFFENGCQGLHERGDIEKMPAVLRGDYDREWLIKEGFIKG